MKDLASRVKESSSRAHGSVERKLLLRKIVLRVQIRQWWSIDRLLGLLFAQGCVSLVHFHGFHGNSSCYSRLLPTERRATSPLTSPVWFLSLIHKGTRRPWGWLRHKSHIRAFIYIWSKHFIFLHQPDYNFEGFFFCWSHQTRKRTFFFFNCLSCIAFLSPSIFFFFLLGLLHTVSLLKYHYACLPAYSCVTDGLEVQLRRRAPVMFSSSAHSLSDSNNEKKKCYVNLFSFLLWRIWLPIRLLC